MRTREYSVVFPMLLLTVGAIFLLDNAGALAISAWDLLGRLWPLLLVAWGLQGLLGRTAIGALLVIVLTLGLGAAVSWYSISTGAIHASPLLSGSISQSLDGAGDADVTIHLSIGSLSIDALHGGSQLLEGKMTEGSLSPRPEFRIRGSTAHYTLESEGVGFLLGEVRWQLQLADGVPLDLRIKHDIGDSTIDLSDLDLREASLDSGVGSMTVTVPDSGRLRIRIDQGVGLLRVNVPPTIEARIRLEGGLGARNIGARFRTVGEDLLETGGYRDATDRVDIDIDLGIGEVVIP